MKRTTAVAFLLILIYLFPALMDLIVSVVGFVNPIRIAKMGHSAMAVAGVNAAWSLVYMIGCLVAGQLLTAANSGRTVLAACICMTVVSALFPLFPGLAGIYVLACCGAVGAALFFPAFQVFMKAADAAHNKPLVYSTGLYTFAWSCGFAVAPFVSGFLMEHGQATPSGETTGWKYCYIFAGLCALVAAVGFHGLEVFKRRRGFPSAHGSAAHAAGAGAEPANGLDLAWLGWISAGAGVYALALIRGIFPARAVSLLHLSDSTQGAIAFLLYLTQALTGLALIAKPRWMYSPAAVGASGVFGIAGTLCFVFGRTSGLLSAGSVLFGVYSGFFFFYFVYHALCHPVKAPRYIGINEAVVGISGLLGPVVGGLVADHAGYPLAFLTGSAAVACATAYQIGVHRRHPLR